MAPPGLSVLGQTHVYVVGKNQSRPPTDNASVILAEAASSEIGLFPFYAVETRYKTVYIYPIGEDEEDDSTLRSNRRRTLEQLSYQQIIATVPKGDNYSVLLNDTIDAFNGWIEDSSVRVLLVNDENLVGVIDNPSWFVDFSHANATGLNQAAIECIEAQVAANHHWSTMFYDPHAHGVNVASNSAVQLVVERVATALKQLNPTVFDPIRIMAGGPDPPCTGMTTTANCLRLVPRSPNRSTRSLACWLNRSLI